jgi:hypothetical protein
MEDISGSTAIDELWKFFWNPQNEHSSRLDYVASKTRTDLLHLFGGGLLESSERLALSILQKALLGIVNLNVKALLSVSTAEINALDSRSHGIDVSLSYRKHRNCLSAASKRSRFDSCFMQL